LKLHSSTTDSCAWQQCWPRSHPVSKSTWWAGVKSGRFPKPVKLGPRITAWRAEEKRLREHQSSLKIRAIGNTVQHEITAPLIAAHKTGLEEHTPSFFAKPRNISSPHLNL